MILIVESGHVSARLTELALQSAGYNDFMTVNSAEEALGVCEESTPEMIVTAVGLPGMSGIDLCTRLKGRSSPCCSVPFLVMSGGAHSCYTALTALAAGAQNFIPKPFTRQKLVKAVNLCMGLAQAQRAKGEFTHRALRAFT